MSQSFTSPFTIDIAASFNHRASKIVLFNNKVFFLETDYLGQTRINILQDKSKTELIPNVKSKVHEYGGGDFNVFADNEIIYTDCQSQQAYLTDLNNNTTQLTNEINSRFCDYEKAFEFYIAVKEEHANNNVKNEIVAISKNKQAFNVKTLIDQFDFVSNPVFNAKTQKLAFLAWNHPNMPWDSCGLYICDIDSNANITNLKTVSHKTNQSLFQPKWSINGSLFYVSNINGFGNLYVISYENILKNDFSAIQLTNLREDINQAQWIFGQSSYDFLTENQIILTSINRAKNKLYTLNFDKDFTNLELNEIPNEFDFISFISCNDNKAAFYASGEKQYLSICTFTKNNLKSIKNLADIKVDTQSIILSEEININLSNGRQINAFFYQSKKNNPLIVKVHGGPTAYSNCNLNFNIQFWVNHGFNYLDVNYCGSFGFGKEYQQELYGAWGINDVNDTILLLQHMIDNYNVDKNKIIITGSSSGGYTALNCLIASNLISCASISYGVSDLLSLAKTTHKFELYYLDTLIGKLPENESKYIKLSPIENIDKIKIPIIFFQGDNDCVVPLSQSESIYNKLKEKNIMSELVIFKNEGHGFRQKANLIKMYQHEFNFFVDVLNLDYEKF